MKLKRLLKVIDTIYIEEKVKCLDRTNEILLKFKNARHIFIEKYTEIFNKKKQNFRIQKNKQALILAYKYDNYVLETPLGFGIGDSKNFYFSHMYNCIYDCRYCFLQGMYSSAALVLFVNYEKFFEKINLIIKKNLNEKVTFFTGYDCDSLAFEKVTGFAEYVLSNVNKKNNAQFEFRTKSVQIEPFINSRPNDNVIVAYSLMPEKISSKLDNKTPTIKKRVNAMTKISKLGWKVGLRFDPLIYHLGWKKNYSELIESILFQLNENNLHSVSFGSLRFPKEMFKKIYNMYPEEVLFSRYLTHRNSSITINSEIENEMIEFCNSIIKSNYDKIPVFSCLSY